MARLVTSCNSSGFGKSPMAMVSRSCWRRNEQIVRVGFPGFETDICDFWITLGSESFDRKKWLWSEGGSYNLGSPKPEETSIYDHCIIPIGSMYAIYSNIYHQYTPNVSIYIYTIHGSYGIYYYTLSCFTGWHDHLAINKTGTLRKDPGSWCWHVVPNCKPYFKIQKWQANYNFSG